MRLVEEIDDLVPVRTVLASVYFKEGIDSLVKCMVDVCPDVKIISTGGTYNGIRQSLGSAADRNLITIEQYTGDPEIAGGLVKSLGYAKSLGLLTNTYWPEHQQALTQKGVTPIDVVVCNFYPFEQAVADRNVTPETARSNMDIGGPTMTNEAAKNMLRVAVLTSPSQYGDFLEELARNEGATSLDFRLKCAGAAFIEIARDSQMRAHYWHTVNSEALAKCYKVNKRGK